MSQLVTDYCHSDRDRKREQEFAFHAEAHTMEGRTLPAKILLVNQIVYSVNSLLQESESAFLHLTAFNFIGSKIYKDPYSFSFLHHPNSALPQISLTLTRLIALNCVY